MNLWLIGMMGSGKSTAGKLAADRIGMGFVDTDEIVTARVGRSIQEFWEEHGEDEFRRVEREAVVEASLSRGVISTGGGVPTNPKNRATIVSTGRVVWLKAEPETILRRFEGVTTRPLLTGPDELAVLAEDRYAAYNSIADFSVDTGAMSSDEVADAIVRWWSL